MFEKVLVEQNIHWEEKEIESGIFREKLKEIVPYLDKKHVLVITGIRRGGKSYLLRQILKHLIRQKINPKNILFPNLENPYFDEVREKAVYLENIFEEYISLTEPNGKIFIFFDEIQFFKNWHVFVKSKYETEKVKFILTGSNSWLLSSEYASLLSGRTIHFELFPFSFKEYLKTKNIEVDNKIKIISDEGKIKKAFKEYAYWGGFPEIILTENEEQKKEIIINYYRNIIYRDIVPRFNIDNARQTEELAHYLLSNIGKLFSYNQLSKLTGLSDKTVKAYINYFKQTYLLFEVNKYEHSVKKQLANLKKIYAGDIGFSQALGFRFSEDYGRILENVVFIELLRRKSEVYYHKEKKECDFVIKNGKKIVQAIQVCFKLSIENRKREISGLLDALESHKLKEGLILTMEQEETLNLEGYRIEVLPVWKFLLEN